MKDKLGVVEILVDIIVVVGGNWIDSFMVCFGGEFVGIVWVVVFEGVVIGLKFVLIGLVKDGIDMMFRMEDEKVVEVVGILVYLDVMF